MIHQELTAGIAAAKTPAMLGKPSEMPRSGWRAVRAVLMLAGGGMILSACISVSAPDKPIVIELNINIKQEVVYKLDKGVQDLIDKNSEIF